MADFLPSDVKGWLELGTQVVGIVDDIKSRTAAKETGQAAGRVAGQAPGFGLEATQAAFDEFGRPLGPDLAFQGFAAGDIQGLVESQFSAGQQQVQNEADTRRQEVLENAEAMGLPSGLIAQQNALIDKWEQETLGTLRAKVDNYAASLLQTQYGQQNIFGLELYDRENRANLLPFELATRYSGAYGEQALSGAQLNLAGQQVGGAFTGSAGMGAAGLIESLGGGEDRTVDTSNLMTSGTLHPDYNPDGSLKTASQKANELFGAVKTAGKFAMNPLGTVTGLLDDGGHGAEFSGESIEEDTSFEGMGF